MRSEEAFEGGPGSGRHKGAGHSERVLNFHGFSPVGKERGTHQTFQRGKHFITVDKKSGSWAHSVGSPSAKLSNIGLSDELDDHLHKFRSKESQEKAPPGWEGTVKAMKKHKDIDNPFALAWSMKNKGDTPHKKESRRSLESRRGDDDPNVEAHNMMGDFLNAQGRPQKVTPGWKNSNVYTPPPARRVAAPNVVIKEF